MQGFFITLLLCSVTMSAVALFYMAVSPLLAKTYSVAGRYYAWLVIVAGFIVPFRPHIRNALVMVGIPVNPAAPMIRIGNSPPVTLPAGAPVPLSSAVPSLPWWQIAAAVWLTGTVIFLTYHVIKHFRFLRLTGRWSEAVTDESTLALFEDLKTQMGVPKPVGLQTCDTIGSPMMTGFVRPRILLPRADFTEDELRFVLKHELIHYRRKDLWYKLLVLTATAVHWFNPVVYLMAKVIAIECELSCDAEVVRGADADTRRSYSETMIGVIRYHSKLKTALSTNFYGGKKGMKHRIISIMNTGRKKAGAVVLCGALLLTMGTGFVFAANTNAAGRTGITKEETKTTSWLPVAFLPDPAVYAPYGSFGITISEDGAKLLYQGQPVRLFTDEGADSEAFYLDGAGSVNLSVIRNTAGEIAEIKEISTQEASEYEEAFFAGEGNAAVYAQDIASGNKYEQYSSYGISLSADGKVLSYNGQRVKLLADKLSDGSFETFWSDEAGAVNLSVVRNAAGQITAVERISEAQAEKYNSALDDSLNGLEERVEKRINPM